MSEPDIFQLSQISHLITDGKHGDCVNESDSGYFFISAKDVKDSKINYEDARQITQADFEETHRRTNLAANDVLITNSGTIGRLAIVPDAYETGRTTFQKSVAIVKPNTDFVVPKFLYYTFHAQLHFLIELAGGTAQKNLLLGDLRRFRCRVPQKLIQKKIAAILSAYDDLIENNKRRIALLEKMAEEIYREWFVRMRFPGHEKVKFVKGVPEGWEVRKISQVYQTSSGGTPSRKHLEYYGGVIPWVKTGELGNSFIFDTEEHITSNGLENSSAKLFPQKTIIIAMYGATIGELGILAIEATTNQACCALQPENSQLGYTFTFHLMKSIKDHLISFAFGGAQQNISQELIKNFQFLLPSKKIVEDFCNQTESIYSMIEALQRSRAVLEKARSSLLPRLISGKLSVEDLDIHFPPSMCEQTTTEQLELDFPHA